jgi:hypothetical protein
VLGEYQSHDCVIFISWTSPGFASVAVSTFQVFQRLIRVYQFEILKNAKNKTRTQVNLKNFFATFQEKNEVNQPTHNRPGAVQRANAIRVNAQVMKLQVVIAYACIAKVNPQGRKKVIAPVLIATMCFEPAESSHTLEPRNFGRVMDIAQILGDISDRFIPRINITRPVTIVIAPIINGDREIIDPKSPSIQPNIQNHMILHILKYRCG